MTSKEGSEEDVPHALPAITDSPSPDQRPIFDPVIERRILRKLDFQLIPPLWLLFLVSFVDRGNIGNAKIAGMEKDLKLKGDMYNTAVYVFNIGYCIGSIPLNLVFKRTGPKSLSIMMFVWGLTVLGQGVTKSWGGLVACRFLEGTAESAFVPGCAYLIGSYYKRNEFLKRYVIFFSAAVTAGAFNGLLASLISKMNGIQGYSGWRWIFIIESLITIVVSVFAFFFIMPFPEHTKIFSPKEKELLLARLEADGGNVRDDKIDLKKALTHLMDWKIWLVILIYIGAEENSNSMINFQPTILRGIGYSANAAQVHTIPVYITAAVFSITCSVISERLRHRYAFVMLGFSVLCVGVAIELALPKNNALRYMGLFFISSGAYLVMPMAVVWISINVGKGYKRAVATAALIGFGNCGAFVAANVFLTKETPRFHTGFATGMAFCCVGAAAATAYFLCCWASNRRRDRKESGGLPAVERYRGDIDGLGERHPDFRYKL